MFASILKRKKRPAPPPVERPELADHLLFTAEHGETAEIINLLDAGAPINAQHENGLSALHLVLSKVNEEAALALITRGANINAVTDAGVTPLHVAASHGVKAAITPLIEAGADVNARTDGGFTALHFAKRGGIARLLIAAGINISIRSNNGETALEITHRDGRREVESAILNAISLRGAAKIKQVVRWRGIRSMYGGRA